jgi:hypothetical protein
MAAEPDAPDQGKPKTPRCVCGAKKDVHLYACGWRCPLHTPARQAGKPEPGEGRYCAPTRCYCGKCPSYDQHFVCLDFKGTIVDLRLIASGKRRAPMHEYRAAQAALAGLR